MRLIQPRSVPHEVIGRTRVLLQVLLIPLGGVVAELTAVHSGHLRDGLHGGRSLGQHVDDQIQFFLSGYVSIEVITCSRQHNKRNITLMALRFPSYKESINK